jgi:hypothetical protein
VLALFKSRYWTGYRHHYPPISWESGGVGADDRVRTGDLNLGKVALYQLSHIRTERLDPRSTGWNGTRSAAVVSVFGGKFTTMTSNVTYPVTVLSDYTGLTTYNAVYGYERPCGRTVLAVHDPNRRDHEGNLIDATDWFGLYLGEVVGPGIIHLDAFPKPKMNEKLLAAAPGSTVTYARARLRKLTDTELAAATAPTFAAAHMPPPKVLRHFGDPVPAGAPDHKCDRCYWQ